MHTIKENFNKSKTLGSVETHVEGKTKVNVSHPVYCVPCTVYCVPPPRNPHILAAAGAAEVKTITNC